MKRSIKYSLILLTLFSATACDKLLDVDRPIDRLVSAYVFDSNEMALAAGLGMYAGLFKYGDGAFVGLYTVYTGVSSDELYYSFGEEFSLQYRENRLLSNAGAPGTIWNTSYEAVYQVNLFLEKIARADRVSPELRDRLTGEARFIRALVYFYLVNTFGNIPLIASSDYHTNGRMGQRPMDEGHSFILADLEAAYKVLTPDYLTTEPIRANKWAAAALLARAHLYRGNWGEAAKYANEVIGSGVYSLVSVDKIGLNSNAEAIFQLAQSFSSWYHNGETRFLLDTSLTWRKPYWAVDSLLVKAFQAGDARRSWIAEQKGADGVTYYKAFKYKIGTDMGNTKKIEHLTVLRLGEQYLILAEALAQMGQLDEAITQLDIIRARAGIPLLKNMNITKTKERLLDLVMEERQRELCFELGHRWFDLNRTGRANTYFPSLSYKDWQPTDRYFPIPESEILLNPFLKQNPGY